MNTSRKDTISLQDLVKKLGLPPITFASYVRSMRTGLDLSQVAMARKLGMSRSTLCDIEKGRHLVSVGLAAKIAKKCGFSTHMAVKYALQDQLTKAHLKMTVEIRAS